MFFRPANGRCEAPGLKPVLNLACFAGLKARASTDTLSSLSRSKTMCLPTRRTAWMRAPSSAEAIWRGGDLSGSGLLPIQMDSMRSPATRSASPRATVSTSGSSGIGAHGLPQLLYHGAELLLQLMEAIELGGIGPAAIHGLGFHLLEHLGHAAGDR